HLRAGGRECVGVSGGGAGASAGGLCESRGLAALELSGGAGAFVGQRPPERCELCPPRVAVPQQNAQFSCRERDAGRGGGGPPVKPALGEAFGAQPKALAIIGQKFQRRAGTIAKDVDGAA